jgi:hypothetical protein
VLVVAGIVVLSLVWVGVRGGMAANAVVAGASSAAKLAPLMYSGDVSGARDEVEAIQASAAQAQSLTSDPIWRTLELVPGLGSNLGTARGGIAALDVVAGDALEPLVDLASSMDMTTIVGMTRVERLASLASAEPYLTKIDTALSAALRKADTVDASGSIAPLADGFAQVHDSLTRYVAVAAGVRSVSTLVPPLVTPATPERWTIVVTAADSSDSSAPHVPVAYLDASTASGEFAVNSVIPADGTFTPDPAAVTGVLTVDIAAVQFIKDLFSAWTIPNIGTSTAEEVIEMGMTGAYGQADATATAKQAVGSLAGAVITKLVS